MENTSMNELIEELRVVNRSRSYEHIARDLGVSAQTVYRWLKYKSKPSQLAIKRITKYLKE